MTMPGFTAGRSLSRATHSYISGRFMRLGSSGEQVSAALVCVDGDCSFFNNGGGGHGGGAGPPLTGQECSDAIRICYRYASLRCRTLPPQQRSDCIDSWCSDICG